MITYQNGCTMPETLTLYEKFTDNPHVYLLQMEYDEDKAIEIVSVGFMHYNDSMLVHFSSDADVGELWLAVEGEGSHLGEDNYVPYGLIEEDKLVELLEALPHIDQFLFEEAAVVH